jgi:hypothetical protein
VGTATDPDWLFKVAGSTYTLPRPDFWLGELLAYGPDGSSLSWSMLGGAMPSRPDGFVGKTIELWGDWGSGSTLVFSGLCQTMPTSYRTGAGWARAYTAEGLRQVGDLVPISNVNTGDDTHQFNADPDDWLNYRAERAGRTAGQILEAVLTDVTLAGDLDALGIGNFTGLPTTPALPATTQADLDAMTVVIPHPVSVGGDHALSCVASVLGQIAPNHLLYVLPDGTLRFLDRRKFGVAPATGYASPITLTAGDATDKVEVDGIQLTQDLKGCASRVIARSGDYAEMRLYRLSDSTLEELFEHDGLTLAQAKTAWNLTKWEQPDAGASGTGATGTCTCSDTLTVVLDPDDNTKTWAANAWDQTSGGRKGVLLLTVPNGLGGNDQVVRKVTANTSLAASGTSTFTVDRALPQTTYTRAVLRGEASGDTIVWRRYRVASTTNRLKIRPRASFPAPLVNANGNGMTLTSTPTVEVLWSSSGSAPFYSGPIGATLDLAAGTFDTERPTVLLFGTRANLITGGATTDGIPSDVRAYLPTATGALQAIRPANSGATPQYSGTSSTVEGVNRTLTITVPHWRDPANQANMEAYATELLDAVKDTVLEGVVPLLRFDSRWLTPGQGVRLAGSGWTSSWESTTLPVVECVVRFGQAGGGPLYAMKLRFSNRRQAFSAAQFERPDRTFGTVGLPMTGGYG